MNSKYLCIYIYLLYEKLYLELKAPGLEPGLSP